MILFQTPPGVNIRMRVTPAYQRESVATVSRIGQSFPGADPSDRWVLIRRHQEVMASTVPDWFENALTGTAEAPLIHKRLSPVGRSR